MINKYLKQFVPQIVYTKLRRQLEYKQLNEWKNNGRQIPPPHILKQITIIEYQKLYGYKVLIETGTFLGDMVEAQKKNFEKIISIELAPDLFEKALKRFKKDHNVIILQGDSGKVLPEILNEVNEPAIFWLDGHYSAGITAKGDKDCPIFEELEAILNSKTFNHIILIDDARFYNGNGDYPTIEKLTDYIRNKNDKYRMEVKDDIIRYAI